jgi:MYXO-CTERM domain-containing protein
MILRRAIFVPLISVLGPVFGAACTEPSADREAPESTSQAIIGGIDSVPSQNAVVLIVRPYSTGFEVCSGTLLAPRLVLTARHCLARSSSTVECASDGKPVQGVVSNDFPADSFLVFSGLELPDRRSGSPTPSTGTRLFDDGAGTLCNHDIGLVILDSPVEGATIAPIRFALPNVGEEVTLVGWGVTEDSNLPNVRQQRQNVKVVGAGPPAGVGSSELVIGEGPCEGDSGGPALSGAGAVIGLSSRGSNGTDATGAAACKNGMNIYTSPAGFHDLILSAYAEVGQDPWLEGQPNPLLAKGGASCSADVECQSNFCAPATHTCTSPTQSAPPEAPPPKKGGCALSTASSPSRSLAWAGAVVALGLLVARRRRARAERLTVLLR